VRVATATIPPPQPSSAPKVTIMNIDIVNSWLEASIREISTQAHFADIAHRNINKKSASQFDTAFTSIHSFLSHCAMVSKMLKGEYRVEYSNYTKVITMGKVLGIPKSSVIHNRKFRNYLEHYDTEIQKWVNKHHNDNIGTYNIGPKAAFNGIVYISHYDPTSDTYTFVNKDLGLAPLHKETLNIKKLADGWVAQQQGRPI